MVISTASSSNSTNYVYRFTPKVILAIACCIQTDDISKLELRAGFKPSLAVSSSLKSGWIAFAQLLSQFAVFFSFWHFNTKAINLPLIEQALFHLWFYQKELHLDRDFI